MFEEAEKELGVTYPKGFKASGINAGMKVSGKPDMALIVSDVEAAAAGTFTQNHVAAAPVYVSKEVARRGKARAIIANSGCANACTGEGGMKDARTMAELAAKEVGCAAGDVFVASTGVIGVPLDMAKISKGIKEAGAALSYEGSNDAAHSIITTDTHPKGGACEVEIGGVPVRFGVIAKGSGMIRPNMATMLCFITTDAAIDAHLLQEALSNAVSYSFNMISVDGDMSTNDSCIILANGAAGNPKITEKNDDYNLFYTVLLKLCQGVAQQIASDGEGATKFITIHVKGTQTFEDAKTVGMSVAKSPLVKTAFFGEDPNWGRVIAAVGYAEAPMDPEKTVVTFGGIPVYAHGVPAPFDMEAMKQVMAAHDIVIEIDMGLGSEDATVWTCDFSYDYVKINGEYHT